MKKAIIFDMDGLMFDTEYLTYKAVDTVLQGYGYGPLSIELFSPCSARDMKIFYNMIHTNFSEDIDLDKLTKDIWEVRAEWIEDSGVPMKKGLLELLKYAKSKDIKMVVATGSERKLVTKYLEDCDILQYFDGLVCKEDVKVRKPNPEAFLNALAITGVSKEEALVLEDSEAGIETARNAGVDVICIPDLSYPDKEHQAMTYKICKDLSEIINEI